MDINEYRKLIDNFPEEPGIYIFKREGKPIYIGKAKNIKKRLLQHFQAKFSKSSFIINEADSVEFIQTATEKEALILEANMVLKQKPKYNVQLKGTEVYPYVSISKGPFPYVEIVRRKRDGKEIYGPFTSVKFLRELLEILQSMLKFRTCKKKLERIKRPCMDYFIGRCIGPCIEGNVTEKEYEQILNELRDFFKGNINKFLENIKEKMEHHAKMLDFENAARYRNVLLKMKDMLEKQGVELSSERSFDVVVGKEGMFVVLKIRGGYLLGKLSYEMEGAHLRDFIEYFYARISEKPPLVVSTREVDNLLEIPVKKPSNEEEKHLVEIALRNLENELRLKGLRIEQLKRLAEFAGLKDIPKRIEGIDISHLQGRGTVASLVVFVDGKPEKGEYRRYRINLKKPDDYLSIKEVVMRRYKKHDLPDILFIDGGIGQVKAAYHGLKKIGKEKKTVILGLAKSEERIVTLKGEYRLPVSSPVVRTLVAVRDEAHRFAVEGNRRIRRKEGLKSVLQSVKGIGPVRRKKLLERFSSIEEIKIIPFEELSKLLGSKKVAEKLLEEIGD
ncbi:MAG: excinuclease ABC subunit UvrC [Thermotogaceae bacterium]|nr:excinuclease ABC subunit UvrC [Thermotogaceae bacterium]